MIVVADMSAATRPDGRGREREDKERTAAAAEEAGGGEGLLDGREGID